CTGNRFSMRVVFPITPTTGLRLIALAILPLPKQQARSCLRRGVRSTRCKRLSNVVALQESQATAASFASRWANRMVFSSSSSLTRWPGLLGVEGRGGRKAGAPADILLFRRDPTGKLEHLSSLEAVIAAGRLYRVADLERAVQDQSAY